MQGMCVAFQKALLSHISTDALAEEECEHIVSLLADKGLDSGHEASALTQHVLTAFDAGAVCALRLIPQLLLQRSATDSEPGAPLCLCALCDHVQMPRTGYALSSLCVCR